MPDHAIDQSVADPQPIATTKSGRQAETRYFPDVRSLRYFALAQEREYFAHEMRPIGPEQSKGGQVVPTPGILHDQIFSVIIAELVQLEICFMRQIPLQTVDENSLSVTIPGTHPVLMFCRL